MADPLKRNPFPRCYLAKRGHSASKVYAEIEGNRKKIEEGKMTMVLIITRTHLVTHQVEAVPEYASASGGQFVFRHSLFRQF